METFLPDPLSVSLEPPEVSTRAEMRSGYPSLDTSSRDTEVGFELRTFRAEKTKRNVLFFPTRLTKEEVHKRINIHLI
ncbi:hypothetical protein T265_08747 [Opisthorchis viverrini]|uniref:Uncharacterized protein n=1 Tax=Opisthorchis viverrini TaxID=6198 RepID=A0A074ZJ14_OPIVI|nr:hypothetical protein T265_08747 [Opisthorchis viverrini]KER23335.1 hypothetical protein T265_08747 [Opisthorchis viverrini]